MTEQQPEVRRAPTCYRHPDRETWVSCGRCGKSLCPDCMHHGPVGVRCKECLRPANVRLGIDRADEPKRVGLAVGIAIIQALIWIALLTFSAFVGVSLTEIPAPNMLVAGLAGGIVGWSMWRICGRLSNRRTAWWAFGIGLAMPLLATAACVTVITLLGDSSVSLPLLLLRGAAAALISGFFAWLLGTQQRGDGLFY